MDHLFEAGKAETAAKINAWLEAADTGSRLAQLSETQLDGYLGAARLLARRSSTASSDQPRPQDSATIAS